MNNLKLFLFTCVFFLFTHNALAGSFTTNISRVSAATFTYGLVFSDETPVNLPGCVGSYENQLSWDKTTEHGKLMMSIFLSAFMAGKSVYIQYSDSECGLWGTRPLITRVDVLN